MWRASCSDSAGEAHPGPQPNARQSSRATEETSRQSVDSWFWAPPVRAPSPRGIRTHLTPAWLVRPWRVQFAHPGASGARRVAGTRAQRALQALYFLPFPSLTPKIPLRLSSSADSLGTVLTPLPLTPQGQHRMNSQGSCSRLFHIPGDCSFPQVGQHTVIT